MRRAVLLPVLALALLSAATSWAAPILAGPSAPLFDASLADLASGFQRQQDVFATLENGLSLDVHFNAADVTSVRDFFAQTAETDFKSFSGKHPFLAIETFEEWGDEGNFAGIASVGVAARLMVLRASGASSAEIDAARNAAVRAARTWHVFGSIGGKGVVARGVRRKVPEVSTDPPLPGALPDVVPLADGKGHALPKDKAPSYRAPVASGFDDWIWFDDTSKDQVSGYALAVAWLWDALRDDPKVPSQVTDDLAHDLLAFAKQLMVIAPEFGIDLCIRDADGRLTSFHDLNPLQVSPDAVIPETTSIRNGFNAALALGVIRAAYHVSGDETIGRYYYEDLVGKRDLPKSAATFTSLVFAGASTNYSNVNMLAIALATLGRFETDDDVRKRFEETLETQFWSTGSDRDASHVQQAWYDVIYGGFSTRAWSSIPKRIAKNLGAFQPAPAFERDMQNCDATEIAQGSCIAVDGTTVIELLPGAGHNGELVAKDIVPMKVRPDSDFEWRSDPHRVNGSASNAMDPRGDWLTAYWLGRALELGDPAKNLSPNARAALPYTLGSGAGGGGGQGGSGGAGGAGGRATSSSSSHSGQSGGCGCKVSDADAGVEGLIAALFAAALGWRRSKRMKSNG